MPTSSRIERLGSPAEFGRLSAEPMPADRATQNTAQRTLTGEIDRWVPIIKAGGEYAD